MVERRAVAHGRVEARLLTNAAFAGNVMLYTSLGYAIHKEEPFMGGTTVHMKKMLARIANPKATKPRAEAAGLHLDRAPPDARA